MNLQYLTNLKQIPLPSLSILFASIWDCFLAQALVLLLCQYTATMSGVDRPNLFLQGGPFRNFQKFFQELNWFQFFMWDILTKLEEVKWIKLLVIWFSGNFEKTVWSHIACLGVVIPELCCSINWEEWMGPINPILWNTL